VLPIRDENPTKHLPFVTLAIIALNVAAFLLWQPTLGGEGPSAERFGLAETDIFFFCEAEIPWEVSHQEDLADGGEDARREIQSQLGAGEGEAGQFQDFLGQECGEKSWWVSIFQAMFLHGSWFHIGGNMLFLWVFGNNVEDKLRPLLFIAFYLAAGLAAAGAQLVVDLDSVIPNLGASGAISGVLGAYIVMFPRRRVLTLVIFFFITFVYLPAFVVLGMWFVFQLISGFGSLSDEVNVGGGIAFWAHIGGFVFGLLMALLFFPKERLGARPPPPRPDLFGRRRWGMGRRRPYSGDDGGWSPY
jgi:membrane associated rhomboid family serine protease